MLYYNSAMNTSSLDGMLSNYTDLSEKTTSGTNPGDRTPDGMECAAVDSLPLAIVSGVVATATILANSLVILAILRGSSHFHRPIYWVIIHLSFADLIVGIMLLWNYCFASLLHINNTYRSLMVIFSIWVSSEASSTIGFVLLAVDRYVQIFHKQFHRTYATRVTVGICIAFAWTFSISVFTIAPMFGWSCKDCKCPRREYIHCNPVSTCSQIVPPFEKSYTMTIATLLFVCIPIPVAIYGTIFFKVRHSAPLVRMSKRRHDMRLIKTLSVILIVFILTLSPIAVLLVVDYTHTNHNDTMISIAFYIFVMAFLNSLANPLLYIWRMTAIRTSIRKMLCFSNNHHGLSVRRDFTSNNSDGRSPTIRRSRYDSPANADADDVDGVPHNNNKPLAAILCLRQIKRGRYSHSRTSTPISDRACNNHLREIARISRDIDRELESDNVEDEGDYLNGCPVGNSGDGGDRKCVITEL